MKTPLLYGLATGTLMAICMIIQYNATLSQSTTATYAGFASMVIAAAGIYLSIQAYRKYSDGYITYGKGVYAGFLTAIYASLVLGVFTFLYLQFIQPDFVEQMVVLTEQEMQRRGEPASQIPKAVEITRAYYKPGQQAMSMSGGAALMGLLFALLAAALLKRRPQNESNSTVF